MGKLENKKIVMFDMDGTILNTYDDILNATNYALKHFGLPEKKYEEMRFNVGYGAYKQIEKSAPEGTPKEKVEEILNFYLPYYNEHSLDATRPYDGIVDVMKKIRNAGMKVAVISNKPDKIVQSLIKQYYEGACDMALGEISGLKLKPAPDMIDKVLKEFNLSSSDSVYVGDTDVDIETAKNSNMDMITVLWGFRDKDFLTKCGGTNFVNAPQEILSTLGLE